jgi:hypothetical protein
MEGSIVPLLFAVLLVALAGTFLELRAAMNGPACPECPHCLALQERRRLDRLAEEERQAALQETYARRVGLRDPDDQRRRD